MASTLTEFAHLQIPLKHVLEATNNFDGANIIGNGGFGPTYKGRLLLSGKLIRIAALRLNRKHGLGDVEFLTQISVLSGLKHSNLISVIGFCDENNEKIIVIPYENKMGSLKENLRSSKLTWMQRLRISVGVARALSYLHHDKERNYGVIHRNINSSTIFLNENWEVKLSGFEYSIKESFNQMDQVLHNYEPFGILGYVDPAIEKIRGVTYKSDIYSFGVVLFEILCGREAVDQDGKFLAPLAKRHYESQTLKDIIHPHVYNQIFSPKSLIRCSKIAYSCLAEEPTQRPNMKDIVDELEKELELQRPRENLIKNLEHMKIDFCYIEEATDKFSERNRIRSSSQYFTLYKAILDHLDIENPSSIEDKNKGKHPVRPCSVFIKRIILERNGGEDFFYNSIGMLNRVKHHNIEPLLGFYVDGSEMILVAKEFCNDYLDNYLGNVNRMRILTWEKRLKICVEVAQSLNYLHDQNLIINSCINRYNISLDENLGVKIVETGLFKFPLSNEKNIGIYFESCGKECYLDPEYAKTRKLEKESDVYSFGVVLFEILCGRKADDSIYHGGLANVVRQLFLSETQERMIDPIIKEKASENNLGEPNEDSLNTFIKIAYKCVEETQYQRPTMAVIVKQLEEALNFQIRNQPEPVFRRIFSKMISIIDAWMISCFSCESTNEIPSRPELVFQGDAGLIACERPFQEEKAQGPNTDQVVDEHEPVNALEVGLTHEILEKMKNLKIGLDDIKSVTDNFSEKYKILDDVYYTCYRAELKHFDKQIVSPVVIKRISNIQSYTKERFVKEIEILTGISHRNIVTLFGFCVEGSEMLLVFDDVSNGYLFDYLTNDDKRRILTWEKRLKICINIANALNYLHFEMQDQKTIIHSDISSKSIGLDENWEAKIVDFQYSAFLPPNQKDEALYPEYDKTSLLKKEIDVYSFGILLLTILRGSVVNDSEGQWVVEDPLIMGKTYENTFILINGPNKNSLKTYREIASRCTAETQKNRPTMKEVIKQLEKALSYQKVGHKISLVDIRHATQDFHKDNFVGKGGFGQVYKGNLWDGDKVVSIVAKRLDTRSDQGERQFRTELRVLSEYEHENIIRYVGYCNDEYEKIIVYKYASNGSLDRYLNSVSLTWVKRLNICIGVASALDFLQRGVTGQAVIHRDIKAANILLNHVWKAKLADFGLSFLITQETGNIIDHVCGTQGYLDPFYGKSRVLTKESDIYSFGVVLFEILCGRSTSEIKNHEGHHLTDFIKSSFEKGKHDEVVFEDIREQIKAISLQTFQSIAYQCLHDERQKRPTIKEVLAELHMARTIQDVASTKFPGSVSHDLQIPLKDVIEATNNFAKANIIARGEFVEVYKGRLLQSGRSINIAARRFSKNGNGGLRFLKEISVFPHLKHKNLVSFIGFCNEQYERIIITYGADETLMESIQFYTWTDRLRMCIGVARAMNYIIHYEGDGYCIQPVYSTVFLDENCIAMLSCFEVYDKKSQSWNASFQKWASLSSFGAFLVEMLPVKGTINRRNFNLKMFNKHYKEETLHNVIDNNVKLESLLRYSKLAYSCLEVQYVSKEDHLPSTSHIIQELEMALKLQRKKQRRRSYIYQAYNL